MNPRSRQNRRESPNFIRTILFEGTNTEIRKELEIEDDCFICLDGRKAVKRMCVAMNKT